jgi:xyloglucan-specific endo-beta-1,4-glucanase
VEGPEHSTTAQQTASRIVCGPAPGPAVAEEMALDRVCDHGGALARGRYLLLNNLWGARLGAGEQCLWAEPAAADGRVIAWSTGWRWTGDSRSVKSYAAAVMGWHFGLATPSCELPLRLSDIAAAASEWQYRLAEEIAGPLNVAYDIWLASTPDPQPEEVTDEIMIWLHRGGGATPIGAPQTTVSVDGAEWELWQGGHPRSQWLVHSFVRTASEQAASLDLARFFDFLASKGLDPARYLVGIEAGSEIFAGAGELDTLRYSVRVDRRRTTAT